MPSYIRMWVLVLLATFGPGQTVSAQERKTDDPADRGGERVINVVEGRPTVLSIKPEGTVVKKGELICELDSSDLRDTLARQRITTHQAEAAYQNARLTREVAETAVTDYVNRTARPEKETAQGEIALAESELRRAEDRLDWSNRMHEKGFVSKSQNIADKISLQQKKFALEQAKTKARVLEKYTTDKTTKELKSEVEKTRSNELAAKAVYEREQATQQQLVKQIEECKIVAPIGGRLSYAPSIGAGAEVGEGKLLLRIVPEDE